MKVETLKKSKTMLSLQVQGVSISYINAIRRYIMAEVPTMAIEIVEFRLNNSPMYDEMLAHRLGLIPLKTDLKSYKIPTKEMSYENMSAEYSLKLTLKEQGPKIVRASDIKSKDPKVVPVFPNTPIVKLLDGQELEFEATAVLGVGKDHVKWSPGTVWYQNVPKLKINNNSAKFDEFKDKYPSKALLKGKLDADRIIKNDLIDACDGVCDEILSVEYEPDKFIVHIEPWGQLDPKEMLTTALETFNAQLKELQDLMKA
ncbi:DNA-directed RNA polymerase subunit D [Candidatus Woesearchaeota archaeon]|nr:DNA-directed RNA polymerase subunit D [Candidatus Woesearchaeota archaeon]